MNDIFVGLFSLGTTATLPFIVRANTTGIPNNPDSAPTYAVYSHDGTSQVVSGQTGSALKRHSFTVNDATNATPIVITTTAAHGLQNGQVVTISGVSGNDAANGTFKVADKTSTTFELTTMADADVAGDGGYTSGGTGNVTGLYYFTLSLASASYEAGKNYSVSISWAVSSVRGGCVLTFGVC